MFYIYVLKNKIRNYIYVGLTNNIKRSVTQHNNGRERTTHTYAPFKIVLTETYNTRSEERDREKYLKSGFGKEYLKSL